MDQVCALRLRPELEQVLMRMAKRANDDGTDCYPGIAWLAEQTGRSERAVQRAISELEYLGLIRPLRHRKGGRGHATEWLLCLERVPIPSPFLKEERVTSMTERVTPMVVKGDAHGRKGDAGGTPVDQREDPEKTSKRSEGVATENPKRRKARTYEPITDEYIEELVREFAPQLGGEAKTRHTIDRALNHKARLKAIDERKYLRLWLIRDVDDRPGQPEPGKGVANGAGAAAGLGKYR